LLQGLEITFAVTEDHHVYVFGSLGIGPTGNTERIPEDEIPDMKYAQPIRVDYLKVGACFLSVPSSACGTMTL
jgi:hypothetical protein